MSINYHVFCNFNILGVLKPVWYAIFVLRLPNLLLDTLLYCCFHLLYILVNTPVVATYYIIIHELY